MLDLQIMDESVAIKFVRKVFNILAETPIKGCGMNSNAHIKAKSKYNQIINSVFDRKTDFKNIFGDEVTMGVQIKTQFKDSVLQTRINPSVKVKDGIYVDTNFHREIDGGAKTLNNIDLNTAFDKSKDHFINKIISDLSTIALT